MPASLTATRDTSLLSVGSTTPNETTWTFPHRARASSNGMRQQAASLCGQCALIPRKPFSLRGCPLA